MQYNERAWTEFICLRMGQVLGYFEGDNEHLGSIKHGDFLD